MELSASQSRLMVQPVKPEDLPVMKMLIQNSACKNASLAFVRDKEEALHGCVCDVIIVIIIIIIIIIIRFVMCQVLVSQIPRRGGLTT